ncbi:uncharacterized protein ZK643.6 [Nematostella vectensis]|uniref:uncharacterized protein ZK643.6 n=1 Tax=Nematostella vectensis TaxID=45351 RepID=UPI002076DE5D|nr:uncharacterized protein ZK643.6 [Nematostella vectensis]
MLAHGLLLLVGVTSCQSVFASSSQTSPPKCEDKLSSCAIYVELGYCHNKLQDYMRSKCAKSCGWCCQGGTQAKGPYLKGCTGKCEPDKGNITYCQDNMRKGECEAGGYAGYLMRLNCPATCGYCCSDGSLAQGPFRSGCTGNCRRDVSSDAYCHKKMKKGECEAAGYAGYLMRLNCPATCGYCCSDGSLAQAPYGQGCADSNQCAGRDRLNYTTCNTYRLQNLCQSPQSERWMKYHCESSCKWCCIDKKTLADGPGQLRCPYKLCVNVYSDEYCQKQINTSSTFCTVKDNEEKCAWSCGACKAPSPTKACKVPFKCCWDGQPATSRGCPRCSDKYPHTCRQFSYSCITGQFYRRDFMEKYCPKTCGICGA